ncbi:type II toxin-antitoxin system RelE/ParE family toxin [Roseospira navarrensis]|uniref:type II toxin-antitoxin system RelE/ParE family toxin n=1 Tax=Roseospira navarrensis TaxID=140058 RepID=UPI0031B5A624
MPDLVWTRAARADLLAMVSYIAEDNPVAAQALVDSIRTKAARLTETPRLYRVGRVDGTREMVVRRRYVVVYRHDAATVTILRVLHTAQHWP